VGVFFLNTVYKTETILFYIVALTVR